MFNIITHLAGHAVQPAKANIRFLPSIATKFTQTATLRVSSLSTWRLAAYRHIRLCWTKWYWTTSLNGWRSAGQHPDLLQNG